MYEYNTVQEAQQAVEVGLQEAVGDNPDLEPEMVYADMVEAVAWFCPPDVARELCRRELGYIPTGLTDLLGQRDYLNN